MTDFAALIHFRTLPGSEANAEGYRGGYGWFLGRFPTYEQFTKNLSDHLLSIGYLFLEFDEIVEVAQASDLNEGEQQELYRALNEFSIQYRTLHLYRRDDA